MNSESLPHHNDLLLENDAPPKKQQQQPEIIIKIVSATYGPCEGLRLSTGELTNDETASIPISRDVAPFLRALLVAGRMREEELWTTEEHNNNEANDDDDEDSKNAFPHIGRVHHGLTPKSFIYLLGGGKSSMNAVFGDPCPGTSKRLYIHYVVTEAMVDDDAKTKAAKTEVHHVSFAEHDRVVLRRRLTFFQDEDVPLQEAVVRSSNHKNKTTIHLTTTTSTESTTLEIDENAAEDHDEKTLQRARRMGRSQSIAELFAMSMNNSTQLTNLQNGISETSTITATEATIKETTPKPTNSPPSWRLRSAVSEIVLPLVLPFLEVRERVQCRLICRSWKHVVQDWGVATTIDSNDRSIANFSRPFLRGILSHSYSSLNSLFLSGFESLAKEDLHPAIPHLRKLRSLDVTRCHNLDDSTMILVAEHVYRTLEVLYLKGLRNVSDAGLKAICTSCQTLEVLEISYVPITDEGGVAIAQLKGLRALFMRDNYHLTNISIDVITEKCARLSQLTLWGCTRIQHLRFDAIHECGSIGKLVILNLWGCHNLKDEAAESLGSMKNLSSLIVSECHRLTDVFVVRTRKIATKLRLFFGYFALFGKTACMFPF
jgi:hypothetical protein